MEHFIQVLVVFTILYQIPQFHKYCAAVSPSCKEKAVKFNTQSWMELVRDAWLITQPVP